MLWLSLGENCLPDDILRRHGKKSFSTPYSSGRTNIDYAIQLERVGYEVLLDRESLSVQEAWGKKVVRSTAIVDCAPIFIPAHAKGFEFTHHDVLVADAARSSFRRKIDRLGSIRRRQDVLFLYHHRGSPNSDLGVLRDKIREFAGFYRTVGARCFVALFHQALIDEQDRRDVECLDRGDGLLEYVFHTTTIWGGTEQDVFWARVDDDLIGTMIEHIGLKIEKAADTSHQRCLSSPNQMNCA